MTPSEFNAIHIGYTKGKENDYRSDWERTRSQLYYIYTSVARKGHPPSYKMFCKSHFPFSWDKIRNEGEEVPEARDPQEAWNRMQEIMSKKQKTSKLTDSNVDNLTKGLE